jgi:glyoxylase-like metal-dependent hydrolase (beta-lactamase superfamily II)
MKVHHLNCGSMRFPTAPLVCHVLVLETDGGLVLVDAGFGLGDIADPGSRIGWFRRVIRPVFDPAETAIRQIEALGFRAADVQHILLTHLDYDHIGGVSDFPGATVHVTSAEAIGAFQRPTFLERRRYANAQWVHESTVVEHAPGVEVWHGFVGVTRLHDVAPGVLLVPLPGHSRGHAAYAIEVGDHRILHVGDAFYHHSTLDGSGRMPLLLRLQESVITFDRRVMKTNQQRLLEMQQLHSPNLEIVNAHSPVLYQRSLTGECTLS